MNKFEWKNFTPTPAEKYVGIAEIKINGDTPFILRFKIVARKDGTGYFPTMASYKMPDRMSGSEYEECFMLDSRSDHDACIKFIMHNVNQWHKQHQTVTPWTQQASIFDQQTTQPQSHYNQLVAQPNQNHTQQTQANVNTIQQSKMNFSSDEGVPF